MLKSNLSWVQNMEFQCETRGLISKIDAAEEHGGNNTAPTPKELVLNAMMGCTAMDVVSILKKMRQDISEFKMEIEAEKTTEHPIHFKTAELIFMLKGNIEPEKAIKAVDSSLTRYCGVNYMISKTCIITFKVVLNDTVIKQGPVNFIEPKQGL